VSGSPRQRTTGLIGAGLFAGVLAVASTTWMVNATSSPAFCASACHSMQWAYDSYKRSPHYDNDSGVRASCGDCHIPYDSRHANPIQYVFGTLWTKAVAGGSDAYHELLGTISSKEKWEQQRPRLTEQVHAWIKKTDSVTCQGCHDLQAYSGAGNFMAIEEHAGLLKSATVDCTSCHDEAVGHVYESAPE
jgi:nitrate/TMAO reductase-like tetraheme cytochrome c subunit